MPDNTQGAGVDLSQSFLVYPEEMLRDPQFWEQFMRRNLVGRLTQVLHGGVVADGHGGFRNVIDVEAEARLAAADPDTYWLHHMDTSARRAFVGAVFPWLSGATRFLVLPFADPRDRDAQLRASQLTQRHHQSAHGIIVQAITDGTARAEWNRVHAPAKAPALRAGIRATGQADPASDVTPPAAAPAPAGMSRMMVGLLAFVGGAAIGAIGMHLTMKPRANPDFPPPPY